MLPAVGRCSAVPAAQTSHTLGVSKRPIALSLDPLKLKGNQTTPLVASRLGLTRRHSQRPALSSRPSTAFRRSQ